MTTVNESIEEESLTDQMTKIYAKMDIINPRTISVSSAINGTNSRIISVSSAINGTNSRIISVSSAINGTIDSKLDLLDSKQDELDVYQFRTGANDTD